MINALGWSVRDSIAFLVATGAIIAVLINVLFMQGGLHRAPMFKRSSGSPALYRPPFVAEGREGVKETAPGTLARIRPNEPAATTRAAAPERAAGDIIADIQRELARRGLYDGAMDGLYGPKTDAAIRDFEHVAGLKPSKEPSEALLQSIIQSAGASRKGITGTTPPARPSTPIRNEGAERLPGSRRIIALQRVLAEYGYGQVKASGVVDPDTQAAIQRFERERNLPITGQPTERVMRELAALTGRPLE